MEDFGLEDEAQVLFVEQPGRFHLDMGLLMIDNGQVIVNDSEESFKKQFSEEESIPEEIKRRKALEDRAAKDLQEGGVEVIRKPLANEKFNFFKPTKGQ
ncbi:hypothetical protein WA1_19850 [Scytonema hofmannii PCC 7110]|uniref:Uncharacterized protein n=1 Tax=Scytonema hofmannii PCC 7110 TaxID=128403 RepID=A0A139XC42_9CYAN|nr:hypothetical protein [Scytonema hofmannii]KYC42236.1 hypothetical protein WA1_19850 [Scytonema hofmannii PCC 7110]